jgi:hypothetical protein
MESELDMQEGRGKVSFFDYIFSLTEDERSNISNLSQYIILSVIPIFVLVKFINIYLPVYDSTKGGFEILFELVFQLVFLILIIWFINKIILYIPTYSNVEYGNISILNMILPLLFILFSLDNNIKLKMNHLYDNLINYLGYKEGLDKEEEKVVDKDIIEQVVNTSEIPQGIPPTDQVPRQISTNMTQEKFEAMPQDPQAYNQGFSTNMY